MPVNVTKVGPGTLTFGAADALSTWSSQVTSAAVEPDSDIDDPIVVLSGETVSGKVTETFNLTGTVLQDFGAVASITEYTWAHSGETVPFTYVPATANGKSITGKVVMLSLSLIHI